MYFTDVKWISADEVSVTWSNRAFNTSVITRCSAPSFRCAPVHTERAQRNGWVESPGADSGSSPTFSKDGRQAILVRPVRDAGSGFFPQLAQITATSSAKTQPVSLTHGTFHVTEIAKWDEDRGFVYYLATLPDEPGTRHLFRVGDLSLRNQKKEDEAGNGTDPSLPVCLTCRKEKDPDQVTDGEGEEEDEELQCEYAKVSVSKVKL